MTRDLGLLGVEVQKPQLNPFVAVHIALDDPVRAWTGVGTVAFGGFIYEGVGALGSISPIGEEIDGAAVGVSVTLSGIDPSFELDLLSQPYRGRLFEVFVGALNERFDGMAVEPVRLWRGYVDSVTLQDGERLSVTITAESEMRDQGRPRVRRYSDQEQRRRYPGDRFFEYLPQLAEVPILWGKA